MRRSMPGASTWTRQDHAMRYSQALPPWDAINSPISGFQVRGGTSDGEWAENQSPAHPAGDIRGAVRACRRVDVRALREPNRGKLRQGGNMTNRNSLLGGVLCGAPIWHPPNRSASKIIRSASSAKAYRVGFHVSPLSFIGTGRVAGLLT